MKHFSSMFDHEITAFVAKDPSEITIRFICGVHNDNPGQGYKVHIFYDDVVYKKSEDV